LGTTQSLEVLLVHPGGPFWRNKDDGTWSIPKGEIDAGEEPRGGSSWRNSTLLQADCFGRLAKYASAAAKSDSVDPLPEVQRLQAEVVFFRFARNKWSF
jgi:predicted NUDIX family NTP pyrophosphohydrolase